MLGGKRDLTIKTNPGHPIVRFTNLNRLFRYHVHFPGKREKFENEESNNRNPKPNSFRGRWCSYSHSVLFFLNFFLFNLLFKPCLENRSPRVSSSFSQPEWNRGGSGRGRRSGNDCLYGAHVSYFFLFLINFHFFNFIYSLCVWFTLNFSEIYHFFIYNFT